MKFFSQPWVITLIMAALVLAGAAAFAALGLQQGANALVIGISAVVTAAIVVAFILLMRAIRCRPHSRFRQYR